MQSFATCVILLTCVLGLYVGARTLRVWMHTRKVPEFAIGTNVFSLALGTTLMVTLAAAPSLLEQTVGAVLRILAYVAVGLHVVALFGGSWRIFRPAARWAALVWGLAVLAMLVYLIASVSGRDMLRGLVMECARTIGFGWSAFECFRYASLMRKRVLLGMADAMVAHRIWLWGVASVAQLVASLIVLFPLAIAGVSVFYSPFGYLVMSPLAALAVICIALAFFPPAVYVRLVSGRWNAATTADEGI